MKALVIGGLMLVAYASTAQQLQIDPAFPANGGSSGQIHSLAAQPDDKVILGGDFTQYGGAAHRSVVRILPSGQADPSFQTGTGATGRINAMRLGADGKVYLGGIFDFYNGAASKNLVRLLPNGQHDTTFVVITSLNNEVLGMEVTPDSGVILGGFFSQYQGLPVTQPLKLLANGQRDTSFNSGGSGTFGLVEVIRVQPDGKYLVAGTITQYNGQAVGRGVIRLLPNGTLDTSFNTGTGLASGLFRAMELQADGKIVLAGSFSNFNGTPVQRLIRLHPNGQLDSTFLVNTPFSSTIVSIVLRRNGNIVAFGNYTGGVGQLPQAIAEFTSNGIMLTQGGSCTQMNSVPQAAAELGDSSIIIAGGFTSAGGLSRQRVARLIPVPGTAPAAPVLGASQTQLCPGITVSMNAVGTLAPTEQWVWYTNACGGTAVDTGSSVLLTPLQTTTYYVRAEAACSPAGLCDSITITVGDSLPPTPLQATLPPLQAVCALALDTPQALSSCGVLIDGAPNQPWVITSAGSTVVTWTYTDPSGNLFTQTQQVQIDTVDVRVQLVNGDLLALNSSASSYQWLHCDQGFAPVPGADSSRFLVPMAGQWAVAITQNGCTDTSACVAVLGSGLAPSAWTRLQLYPNPSTGQVHLQFDAPLQVQLHDLQGRLLFETQTEAGSQQLNLPQLPAGVYVWRLRNGDQLLHRRQLLH